MENKEIGVAPGSKGATAAGCTCPVIDNCYGRGYMMQEGAFVFRGNCPIHGFSEKELKTAHVLRDFHDWKETIRKETPKANCGFPYDIIVDYIVNNGENCRVARINSLEDGSVTWVNIIKVTVIVDAPNGGIQKRVFEDKWRLKGDEAVEFANKIIEFYEARNI